ncbi:MAG: FG-GAP repeat protein [Myxococcota bacterium]|nr:FG-GAP repeat protein [Myxococcota bacterium]
MLLSLFISCNPECIGINCAEPNFTPQFEVFFGSIAPDKATAPDLSVTHSGDWVEKLSIHLSNEELYIGSPQESAIYRVVAKEDLAWDLVEEEPLFSISDADSFGDNIHSLRFNNESDSPELLLVSAPKSSHLESAVDVGAVFILEKDGSVITEIRGSMNGYEFGDEISVCSDLDGDGWEDWIAAQSTSSTNSDFSGEVIIGLSSIWRTENVLNTTDFPRIYGDSTGARFGGAISCNLDVDGNNLTDIFIGAAFQDSDGIDASGSIYRIEGIPLSTGTYFINSLNPTIYAGLSENDWLGWSLAVADLVGSSTPELIAGAPGIDEGRGEIWIWRGEELNSTDPLPRYRIVSTYNDFRLGEAITTLDMNGDSQIDLLVGAPQSSLLSRLNTGGGCFGFLGEEKTVGWPAIQDLDDADWQYFGDNDKQHTGLHLKSSNLNDDEFSEWAVYSEIP